MQIVHEATLLLAGAFTFLTALAYAFARAKEPEDPSAREAVAVIRRLLLVMVAASVLDFARAYMILLDDLVELRLVLLLFVQAMFVYAAAWALRRVARM